MGAALTRATLRGSMSSIRYVEPIHPRRAGGLVAQVYRQVQRDFGLLAPPVSVHSASPPVLAATWMLLRESLIAGRPADRPAKEAVAAAVSAANECPYCAEVHGVTLRGLTGRRADGPVPTAAAGWARDTAIRPAGGAPPPPEPAAELAAVAFTFHYLNRMVNVFLAESPLPAGLPGPVVPAMRRLAGRVLGPVARRPRPPGESLALLPDAPLPADLAWTTGHPALPAAFARAAAAYDRAGERSVPPAVRELVAARLADWDGTAPGPGADWATTAAGALAPADRPAGVLALLTALASYQVTPRRVAGFPDQRLVEITAWASFAAARRIGSWAMPRPSVGN